MKRVLLILAIFCCQTSGAQPVQNEFTAAFKKFQNDDNLKHATIGLFVYDLKSGKNIFTQNAQAGLVPASTQKIVTAATAYALLGKDFRYETKIGYSGKIENGRLTGNIIIRGGGDPTLGSWRYESTKEHHIINGIIAAILQSGVKELNGHVLTDESLFSGEIIPDGWIWQDLGNYYGAGAQALNWRENQFELYLKSGAGAGSDVEISGTKPDYITGLNLKSALKAAAAGTGDNAYIYPPLFGRAGWVRGTIPVNQRKFSISGTLPGPGRQLAITIEAALKKIPIEEAERFYPSDQIKDTGMVKEVYSIESPSLDSICYWFLQKSINLYGEALIKTLGEKFGKAGTTAEGIRVIQDFWKKQGIDSYALNMMDGSGLSPQNRITADALVRVLMFAKKQPWFDDYFRGFPAINGIKMKSGTIGGVLSYTGFIPARDGNYIFAFIVNNYNGSSSRMRTKMWQLLDILK